MERGYEGIIIARRWSKLEYDAHRLNQSEKETRKQYQQLGLEERMMSSHLRQMASLDLIRSVVGDVPVIVGDALTRESLQGWEKVIALGGDGHFSYVSHFIDNQTIIGINADTEKSTGAILEFTPESFTAENSCLRTGTCQIEPWTRLQIVLDGKPIDPLAVSDVYIGAKLSVDMSRYVIEFQGEQEEQKTSGVLVATGTGSTGWYSKMFQTIYQSRDEFSRSDPGARFLVREEAGFDPQYFPEGHHKLSRFNLLKGTISPDSQLILHSLTDEGVVSIDTYRDLLFPFDRGSTVQIFPSDKPLQVLKAR